jgi:hypothetical protein
MDKDAEEAIARVRAIFGTEIDAKPIHAPISEDADTEVVDLLTRICYFYPQYTIESAEKLTNMQVMALLVQAEKQKAIEYYNHTLIAAAPHSKKGQMVNKLIKQYRKIAYS